MSESKRFIPVFYSEIPVQELEVDDVVHAQGKVSKVYITEKAELFETEDGQLFELPAVVYEIPSVLEGSFVEHRLPLNSEVKVLFHREL